MMMKKINSQAVQDINGLFTASKTLKNKLITEEKKISEEIKINSNNENKNKESITSPNNDKKFQNLIPSYIPINTLSDMSNNFNLNSNNALITSNEMKKDINKNNQEEVLENGLNIDEQNIVNYYEKVENKINIIKNEQKGDINNIKNEKNSIKENKYLIENNKNNNSNESPIKNETQNLPFGIQIPKELFDKIEYAIDENGNPFSIKNISTDSSIKKPVALIIEKGNKADNYLIDLKGKKISKMEDGYYNYKNNNTRVLIKDFDVQHPELRVYGTRSKETLTIQDIDKDKDEEIDNNQSKKYSIVLNKRILNLKRNSPIKIKNMKYMKEPKTDNRIKYINKNKKQISFKKIVPIPNSSIHSQYPTHKYSNNYTLNRTSSILNKSSSNISYHNRSYTSTSFSKIDINNKKLEQFNNTVRNKGNKISVTPSREIKDISFTSSKINLFNYKRNAKRGGSFSNINKAVNLKNINIIHRNSQSLISLASSNIDDNNTFKDYSSIYNNNKSINTNYSSIQNKNIKKSKSSFDVSSTINSISNKIKYIKNKINNSTTPTTSTISTNNSQINNISNNYNNYKSYTHMNPISNNNSLYKRQYKCAILSKEVNDIISDYSVSTNKNEPNNKFNNHENHYTYKIQHNNKINSFLNGHSMTNLMFRNNINLNNFSTEPNYYNADNSNDKIINADIKDNKNNKCNLCGKYLLNKIKSQYNSNVLNNGIINFKRRKMSSLLNVNNNKTNFYPSTKISQNYMHNINLLKKQNSFYNRNKINLINSRNAILNLEENKSQTSFYDFFGNNANNTKYDFNYSVSNVNNERNFNFS